MFNNDVKHKDEINRLKRECSDKIDHVREETISAYSDPRWHFGNVCITSSIAGMPYEYMIRETSTENALQLTKLNEWYGDITGPSQHMFSYIENNSTVYVHLKRENIRNMTVRINDKIENKQ